MSENGEQRTVEDELRRIGSQLGQIKILVAILIIVSPLGLYCILKLINNLPALVVIGFGAAVIVGIGYVLVLCVARLTGTHKTLELKQDELARILKNHGPRDGSSPV